MKNRCQNLLLLLFLVMPSSIASSQEKEHEMPLLKKICLINFEKELKESEFIPPSGMASYTCDCFLEKVTNGTSIEFAQKNCKEEASKKYNLLR